MNLGRPAQNIIVKTPIPTDKSPKRIRQNKLTPAAHNPIGIDKRFPSEITIVIIRTTAPNATLSLLNITLIMRRILPHIKLDAKETSNESRIKQTNK